MITSINAKLIKKYKVSDDMIIFSFKMITPTSLNFQDGQYISIQVGNKTRRSYSILSSRNDSKLEFDVLLGLSPDGIGVNYFKQLNIGDIISAKGPLGFFVLPEDLSKNIVFICTGSGFAPVNSMIKGLLAKQKEKIHNIHLFYGARYSEDIVYQTEYDTLRNIGALKTYLKCITRDISCGIQKINNNIHMGRVTIPVQDFLAMNGINDTQFFLCGSGFMINEITELLNNREVLPENIHHEKFY